MTESAYWWMKAENAQGYSDALLRMLNKESTLSRPELVRKAEDLAAKAEHYVMLARQAEGREPSLEPKEGP